MPSKSVRKIYRSESDRVLAGVAAGLADYFDVDVRIVRLIVLVLVLFGPGLPAYIVAWIIIPSESQVSKDSDSYMRANAKELKNKVKSIARDTNSRREWGGIIILAFGCLFLLQNFSLIPWQIWGSIWRLWPLILILIAFRILGKHGR